MLPHLTLIFLCQLLGEVIVGGLGAPIPGPVIGMALLFGILLIRGGVPKPLAEVSGVLQGAMSLLFVPAGAGVMLHLGLLEDEALPIAVALLVSTLVTIGVTGLLMQRLGREAKSDG